MTTKLATILHDLNRIAEAQKELNIALDKVCNDVLTHVNGGGNGEQKILQRGGEHTLGVDNDRVGGI